MQTLQIKSKTTINYKFRNILACTQGRYNYQVLFTRPLCSYVAVFQKVEPLYANKNNRLCVAVFHEVEPLTL